MNRMMTQDMKKDMILHTIAKRLVRHVRTNRPSPANSQSVPCVLKTMCLLLMLTLGTVAWATDITSLSSINQDGTGDYVITQDIDASGFSTIATFSGTLEAAINPNTHMPYKITNLSKPLFTTLTGTVKNLVLEDVDISQSGKVGSIACTANDAARIYNVGIFSGSVGSTGTSTANNSTDCCGGLVGELDGTARVINCYSYADITDGNYVGGIVGYNKVATASNNLGLWCSPVCSMVISIMILVNQERSLPFIMAQK